MMLSESQRELLARIEDALALADAQEAHDVALWLDRARIAAGGASEFDAARLTYPGAIDVVEDAPTQRDSGPRSALESA